MFKFKKIALTASIFTATALSLAAFAACGAEAGAPGKDGANGKDGVDGKDGVSITAAVINEDGELIITYSNGDKKSAGKVYAENETPATEGHVHTLAAKPLTYVRNMNTGAADATGIEYEVGDRVTGLYKCDTCGEVLAQESHIDNWNGVHGEQGKEGYFNRQDTEAYIAGWDFTLPADVTVPTEAKTVQSDSFNFLKANVTEANRSCYINEADGSTTLGETQTLKLIGASDIYEADGATMKAEWVKIEDNVYYNNTKTVNGTEERAGAGWMIELKKAAKCSEKAVFQATYCDYAQNAAGTAYDDLKPTNITYAIEGTVLDHFYDVTEGFIVFENEIKAQNGATKVNDEVAYENWTASMGLKSGDVNDLYVPDGEDTNVSADEIKNYKTAYYVVVCANCETGDDDVDFVQMAPAKVSSKTTTQSCTTGVGTVVTASYSFVAGEKTVVITRDVTYADADKEATGHTYMVYDEKGVPQYKKDADGKHVTNEFVGNGPYTFWALDDSKQAIAKTCIKCDATTTIAIPTVEKLEKIYDVRNEIDFALDADEEAYADLVELVMNWETADDSDEPSCTEGADMTLVHDGYEGKTINGADVSDSFAVVVKGVPAYGHHYEIVDAASKKVGDGVTIVCKDDEPVAVLHANEAIQNHNGEKDSTAAGAAVITYNTVELVAIETVKDVKATCLAPGYKMVKYTVEVRTQKKTVDGTLVWNENGAPVWADVKTETYYDIVNYTNPTYHGGAGNWETVVVAEPTATAPGQLDLVCKSCGEVLETVILPAVNPSSINANYSSDVTTAMDCETDEVITVTADWAFVYIDELTTIIRDYYDDDCVIYDVEYTKAGKSAQGHKLGAWITATGSEYEWVRYCQNLYDGVQCGYFETTNVNPNA